MKKEQMTGLVTGLAWAAGMIGVALAAAYAHRQGYIDADTKLRVLAMNGLMVAWLGNRMPKAFVPSACARQAKRVGGWALVLSGLAYAGLFAFAPIPVASTVGTGALVAGMAVTLGYCLWLFARTKTKAA